MKTLDPHVAQLCRFCSIEPELKFSADLNRVRVVSEGVVSEVCDVENNY